MGRKCKCGRYFVIYPSEINRAKFCSKACFYKYRIRPKGLTYKVRVINRGWFKFSKGWTLSKKGYKYIYIGKGRKRIRVFEHRYKMEQHLKRKLLPNEVIHHVNGNKLDNDISNLQLIIKKLHDNFHKG